ncbi:uncharacterized protein LOC123293550 [Chrysoperla carnea]|uniref:uncharacterized protein LOC123293550 n=1 Tax=Chrysoperla carnea TaxID=189513 RepID=UPI001D067690|nr:uncharacterized protein LOC123293550 [Chrysoperla carnea]
MSIYIKELNKQERKLQNERNILVEQLKLMNEQLNNLQVERMQLLQNSNKNKKVPQKSKVALIKSDNDINMDNESEINNIPVSLNASAVLNDMLHGQFTDYKNEDMEREDD